MTLNARLEKLEAKAPKKQRKVIMVPENEPIPPNPNNEDRFIIRLVAKKD